MKNPFPFERINIGDCFYGREDSLEMIRETANHGNNLLVYSKRRTGKSALVTRFGELYEKEFHLIYVDLFDLTSKEDFAKHLLKSLANSTTLDITSTIKKFGALFKRVRLEATIDPNTAKTSVKPIVSTLSFDEMMEDFFASVTALSKEKNVVVALDEFQQIAELKKDKIDALLRGYIQNRGERVSYIFLGSKRHLLTSLFHYKEPLFEMATHYVLPPLTFEAIKKYVSVYVSLSDEMIHYIQEVSAHETKLMQNIFYLLFMLGKDDNDKEVIDSVVDIIIDAKDSSYRMILDSLASSQKTALKIIGKYPSGFYIQDVFDEYGITKQSLQSAINTLLKKEIIDKENDKYFVPERTFELWIKKELV